MDPQCPVRLASRRFMHDPYPALASLRDSMPAAVVEAGGLRMWLVTRYEDVRRILADREVGKDLVGQRRELVPRSMVDPSRRARLPAASRRSLLDRDGDDHRRLRGALAGVFSPARLAVLKPEIERRASALLDRLPVGEPVELLTSYVRPLVATTIADLVGVPEDERAMFPVWETAMLTAPSIAEVEEAGRELYALALRLVERKRAEPGDDVCTMLLGLRDEGVLDDDELASTFIVLLIGGSEPASAITSGLSLLLRHPAQLRAVLDEPALWPNCVEEIVRYEAPFRMLPPRFSADATVVDDVEVPARELLLLSPGSANRDPLRFSSPDSFDVRRDTRGHLGFGHGAHRCLGAELGRLETRIALRLFFERFPAAGLEEEPVWLPGLFMRRLGGLRVRL
ncbi:cytochrome P450 [Lentzea sp. NPDC051213]|uniref:cytochrome P450 n=1 Tax=Lentzea sp. NPDC051213 TaxID=3364126 RepID=UPI003791B177